MGVVLSSPAMPAMLAHAAQIHALG
jgi:hypothetical protein